MSIQSLINNGVNTIFGYHGGATIPIHDKINQYKKLQYILVRHEQVTTFGAQGYARSTGKVGVALTTSGPGTCNALTGLMDAYMDSIPILLLSG